jgi:alkylation response protein AidB-like acyl-CoA dehydrogenase
MNILRTEREALERYLPGLEGQLRAIGFEELESASAPAIAPFRNAGGAGLLIPKRFHGLEASPLAALRIHRALGSCAPSLAVATTMHQFSVAMLLPICTKAEGMEWVLLQAIAQQRLLLASGFAEGDTGRSALKPAMRGSKVPGGILVSGSKKPCSLSRSMNLLTASVSVVDAHAGSERFAVTLIAAESKGIERRPFWNNIVLNGAESDELLLDNVFVPERLVFYPDPTVQEDSTEGSGFLWFELLISASYLGIASGLAERAIAAKRGEASDRVAVVGELESAMAGLESVAASLEDKEPGNGKLARALFVRYSVQHAIERATAYAFELLGGTAFIRSPEASYLYAAARGLAFHPPSRLAATAALDRFIGGEDLNFG